jgi:hypothetical protein
MTPRVINHQEHDQLFLDTPYIGMVKAQALLASCSSCWPAKLEADPMVPDRKILALGNVIKEGGAAAQARLQMGLTWSSAAVALLSKMMMMERPHFQRLMGSPDPTAPRVTALHCAAPPRKPCLTARTIIRFKPDTHTVV